MRGIFEIEDDIKRLEENKVKSVSMGSEQHIDIMIDVIKNDRSKQWIYENYPNTDNEGNELKSSHEKWQSAIGAREYLDGEQELNYILFPE